MKKLLKTIANIPALKTDKKYVIILSDDWGSLRMRSANDQMQLARKGVKIDNRFDRYDTLESDTDMECLFEVLLKHKDFKGNHPIITAVTNVANPDFHRIKEDNFTNYYFETNAATYQRTVNSTKVPELVKQGIKQNIFFPQSHGREHLQINWWMNELGKPESFARSAFDNQFFFLRSEYLTTNRRGRDLAAAFDVIDEQDVKMSQESIVSALDIFENIYSYQSKLFVPPAMFYSTKVENTLAAKGIEWLDVGRFSKLPNVGGGESFKFNYLGKKKYKGIRALVRNSVFESNLSDNDNGVSRCMHDIEQAFKSKQPALISNHRASFVGGIDVGNRDKGLLALDELLSKITAKWGDVEFVNSNHLNSL